MFDPYDRNISAMMEENEWIIPYVTEALATDTDSSEWENRLRNSAEGGLLGTALEGVVALSGISAKAKKAQAEYTENGKVTAKTAKELEDAQVNYRSFLTMRLSCKQKHQK